MTEYVTLTEILNLLDAKTQGTNHLIFSLPISPASAAAQIAYVNELVTDYASGITDSLVESRAKLAAKDLGCLAVCVVAAGGMIVKGYDFKLADMSMSKSGTKSMIMQAIYSYQDRAKKSLQRLFDLNLGMAEI